LNDTESGASGKPSPFHGVKRFQQAKPFPVFIHLLSCVYIFRRECHSENIKLAIQEESSIFMVSLNKIFLLFVSQKV